MVFLALLNFATRLEGLTNGLMVFLFVAHISRSSLTLGNLNNLQALYNLPLSSKINTSILLNIYSRFFKITIKESSPRSH